MKLLRKRLRMIAACLLVLMTQDPFSPKLVHAANSNSNNFGTTLWNPETGSFKKGDNPFTHQWDGIKDRFSNTFNSPGAFFGSAVFFLTGLGAVIVTIQVIGELLCDAFGWWCSNSGSSGPPVAGATTPFCADSTGTAITDPGRAKTCCTGANLDQTPNPPSPGCSSVYPPQELSSFPFQMATAQGALITALNNAKGLQAPTGTVAPMGNPSLAQGHSDAATAGDTLLGGSKPNDRAGAGGSGGGPLGSGGRGGAGGAMGGGGSGGSSSSFGNLHTEAMSVEGATGPSGPLDGTGGAYTSGNGAVAAMVSAGHGLFGNGLGGEGTGSGSDEAAFGADMNGTTGQASTSDDPADYFTRLGLGDNIFKVVERRYRQKSSHWVTDDLQKPMAPVSPLKK